MKINFENAYYNGLTEFFYSSVNPSRVISPSLVIFNKRLAEKLDIKMEGISQGEIAQYLSGNKLMEGSVPIAQAYAGHQFGNFTKLGDGRAVLLGDMRNEKGETYDIQLKGSGPTPYSRRGDGRAALGPMLREYIISEAMYNLGIPTTESLGVVTTGEKVYRNFEEKGAILTRVSKSHIRVGTFEYAYAYGDKDDIKRIADFTIDRYFPNMKYKGNKYLGLIKAVVELQASLVAKWQSVGFIHGVMNTDNISITGETIDYGPCAFMDEYNPDTVYSSIDRTGRYSYSNQPNMAYWGLIIFAKSLLPLVDENREWAVEQTEPELERFMVLYKTAWLNQMRNKLGLTTKSMEDEKLIKDLLDIFEKQAVDFTNSFVKLTTGEYKEDDLIYTEEFRLWEKTWLPRLSDKSRKLMERSNPFVIPRNHMVEEVISQGEKGEYNSLNQLIEVISRPYDYTADILDKYKVPIKRDTPYRTFCGT